MRGFLYRQPSSAVEVANVLAAAAQDLFDGCACDGDSRWTPEAVCAWWSGRAKVEEHVATQLAEWTAVGANEDEREAADGVRDFLAYLAGDHETDLRVYVFRLDKAVTRVLAISSPGSLSTGLGSVALPWRPLHSLAHFFFCGAGLFWKGGDMAMQAEAESPARRAARGRGLAGQLQLRQDGVRVTVELDVPVTAERLPAGLVPAAEALAMGFHLRTVERLRGSRRMESVMVSGEFVAVQMHQEDVEHVLAGWRRCSWWPGWSDRG